MFLFQESTPTRRNFNHKMQLEISSFLFFFFFNLKKLSISNFSMHSNLYLIIQLMKFLLIPYLINQKTSIIKSKLVYNPFIIQIDESNENWPYGKSVSKKKVKSSQLPANESATIRRRFSASFSSLFILRLPLDCNLRALFLFAILSATLSKRSL